MAASDFTQYLRKQQELKEKASQQYRQPIQPQQVQRPQYPQYKPVAPAQYPHQPYPRPAQPAPPGAHSKLMLIVLVCLGLIGVTLLLLFVFGSGEDEAPILPSIPGAEEQETITFSTTEFAGEVDEEDLFADLTISQIKFASDVRDDLSFDEVSDGGFLLSEQPWIIFDVSNLASGSVGTKWQTSYDEYIVVIGPDGQTVDDLTGFLGTTTENADENTLYDFPIAHQLLTDVNYKTGEYEVTIFIDDLLNGVEATQSATFTIR